MKKNKKTLCAAALRRAVSASCVCVCVCVKPRSKGHQPTLLYFAEFYLVQLQGAEVCFRCLQPTKTQLSHCDIVLGRQNYVPAPGFPNNFSMDCSKICSTDPAIPSSQGLNCSNAKVLLLTAHCLKPRSAEHSSYVSSPPFYRRIDV